MTCILKKIWTRTNKWRSVCLIRTHSLPHKLTQSLIRSVVNSANRQYTYLLASIVIHSFTTSLFCSHSYILTFLPSSETCWRGTDHRGATNLSSNFTSNPNGSSKSERRAAPSKCEVDQLRLDVSRYLRNHDVLQARAVLGLDYTVILTYLRVYCMFYFIC